MPVIDRELKRRFRTMQKQLSDPLLTVLAVLLLLMMFGIAPLHAAGIIQSQDYGIAAAAVAAAAVLVMSGSVFAVAAMLASIGLVIAATFLTSPREAGLDLHLYIIAWITLGTALFWVVARIVFAPGRVTYHRIVGAILLYLIVGMVFASLFALLGLLVPGSLSGVRITDSPGLGSHLLYFSFVTLTTVGYGDIVPVHPLARSLCNVEAIIGQLYPATLLARLVSLEIEDKRRRSAQRANDSDLD